MLIIKSNKNYFIVCYYWQLFSRGVLDKTRPDVGLAVDQ